jgi:hypothetical protein
LRNRFPLTALSFGGSYGLSGGYGNHTHPEEFLDNFWQKEINTRGETVTYKFKKDNYYVISGINPNGYEFYHKVFFYPTYWLEFEITYPQTQHVVYDGWVERIAHDVIGYLEATTTRLAVTYAAQRAKKLGADAMIVSVSALLAIASFWRPCSADNADHDFSARVRRSKAGRPAFPI